VSWSVAIDELIPQLVRTAYEISTTPLAQQPSASKAPPLEDFGEE
jgi:hypothetical protein